MADDAQRKLALERIRQNIAKRGHHIYVVSGGPAPRFAYTIGISESRRAELILAGASFYSNDEVVQIINDIAPMVTARVAMDGMRFEVAGMGSFSLRKADPTWAAKLILGALDYYGVSDVPAFQIVPDEVHWTIDIPNLSERWSAVGQPVWQWLDEPWKYSVPSDSVAVTNVRALRGERVTEVTRWEEDEWEIFAGAGPDVPAGEIRRVPLGTLLASDVSLDSIVDLPVEGGLWRDAGSDWHPWR